MKHPQAISLVCLLGLLLACLWLIGSLESVSRNQVTREAPPQTNPRRAQLDEPKRMPVNPFPAEASSWQEKLPTLQADKELFGASGDDRMKELQKFVESFAVGELPDVLAALRELQMRNPTETGRDLQLRVLRRWAENDPRRAAEWAVTTPGAVRHDAVATAAGAWASRTFSEAATWALQLSDSEDRQDALQSVAAEAVYSDPTEALKLAAQLPADPVRDDLVTRAVGAWAGRAPEEALFWAKQITEAGLRQQMLSAIAITWGARDPIAAATLAVEALPAGPAQDAAVIAIVQRWALKDASAATEWVGQFPEGNLRQVAMETLAADAKRSRGPVEAP